MPRCGRCLGGGGGEAGGRAEGGGVGVGLVYVAWLHGQEVFAGFASYGVLDAPDIIHKLGGLLVADVVYAVWRGRCGRVGVCLVPIGIALRYDVDDAYHTFHDVVDIGEVAQHVAVVEDLDGAVVQDGVDEEEGRHVGASPRAVDGEEA